ncbi:MAG: nuclear transport factor 2 family protein [Vicinamibacterales bacterium]
MTEIVEAVVEAFNDCINRRDIDGLAQLMTDGHRFVDAASGSVSGKRACLDAWKRFFQAFPDYRNHFDRMITTGSTVVMVGRSSCSDHRLEGPALWRAVVSADCVDEWHVFEDTPANRFALGIAD